MVFATSGLKVQVAHAFEAALAGAGSGLVTPDEWDALLGRSASNVVFLARQWLGSWWRHFGQGEDCRLQLLVLREEGGALVGIAPLFVAREPIPPVQKYTRGVPRPGPSGGPVRAVKFVGGTEVADYLDMIAPAERLEQVWGSVLDYLLERRGEWDVIDLHSLPEWSRSREVLPRVAEARGLHFDVFAEDVCPVAVLPGEWETYLMSLRKKDRHELRRKVRKLEGRDDSRWYLVPPTDPEAIERAMNVFLELHRRSGADKARFMDEQMEAYFRDMAHALLPTGWLDVAILEMDGQPASAYFSYNYEGRLYLYNSGYDPRFASYSAGVALLAYRIHKAILQGVRYFDFLRGDEDYKYDFGAKDTYVYRALCRAANGAGA
jgi:CelD/BcsL family acetyltransferase involved in cellulose biosynthesis